MADYSDFIFCFFFTSQAGIVITTAVGLTLVGVTGVCNIFLDNFEDDFIFAFAEYLLLYLFLLIMGGGYISAFIAAYQKDALFAKLGAFLIGIGTCLYVGLSILSILPGKDVRRLACVGQRCPDHFWLVISPWRDGIFEGKGMKKSLFILVSLFFSVAIISTFIYTTLTVIGFSRYIERQSRGRR